MDNLPALPLPEGIRESYLPSHDLTYHYLSSGNPSSPLILLLHGFPELAFSWRKIMPALAAEGYHVVAYDQRGYGRTTGWDSRPFAEVDLNTFALTMLVRDAVILVNALGYHQAEAVIGHDFGATGSAMCALMRPDIFKSCVMMSHPFKGSPSLPFNTVSGQSSSGEKSDVHKDLAKLSEPRKHYKWYYSTSPAAEEMDNPKEELHQFLRGYFHLKSADWKGNDPSPLKAWEASELAKLPYYYVMPLHSGMRDSVRIPMANEDPATVSKLSQRWLNDEELSVYSESWKSTGFQGGLNWYRVATDPKNMKDVELFAGKKIDVPSLFISGKQDWGTYQEPGTVENMGNVCSRFKGVELIDGAGHWVQQEQPEKVIEILAKFLREVKKDAMSY
ncbi:alpha/beta-Hydrolase [Glarea lozoyensis ATCC 20868]|uniref:Alpha/beta-Hydrolase n=1 Tax=Glarea lozoyensis (strain ATCC 20868 / MF5171) TaxID=1116229 RepID=S3DV37_GLAL2|nr:alpha/beta-Hydrolase [Glarea lozoyensis ATCC 20868]EPE35781.1 alpha/beta-Hydrolase [Glarea lozoyensis ATCC 20868]